MLKNNWITHNLQNRIGDPALDFKTQFNPIPFKQLDFQQAIKYTIDLITSKYDNFYLSYSGGLDSEFILKAFYEAKVPIKPIIVKHSGNDIESQYAFHMCKKLNIEPLIINCSDKLYLEVFRTKISNPINGMGWDVTPGIIAFLSVKDKNHTFLTGEHVIDDEHLITKASLCEWDFYHQFFYPEYNCIGPLLYTPEITYSIIKEFDGGEVQDFKSRLFNIDYRPKIKNRFEEKVRESCWEIIKNKPKPKHKEILGSKKEVTDLMESWNVDNK